MNKEFEKILKRLEEQIKWYETHGSNKDLNRGIIGANRHAISIVQEIAEEYNNGWISCSEQLPKKDGFYLATLDGEIAGEEKPFSGLEEFENGKWVDDEEDYQCVLAWQPLPEPYKPEGE